MVALNISVIIIIIIKILNWLCLISIKKFVFSGMKFALLEMKILLSSVILTYDIKLNSATVEPLLFDPGSFFYKAVNPILLDFEKII